ncbi:MAG: sulfatase-like hydrolase/transferase, partial [Planctomycetota bacterium]|nr:sulfatase-like hydrolase/transferase [Planctomycetota bacterium]
SAFGKWHNTPATQTTSMGPFEYWPTGYGFDHFYGFLAGETSQYEPRLVENTNQIEPPIDESYHLTEDMADKAIRWLKRHRSFTPDAPFCMYWAPGAAHGPHHVFPAWADKYKGAFDDGWDALRAKTFAKQKQLGWIPADTKLTARADTMPAWDSIPAAERAFQTRLMEVFAGFVEHTDAQVGKLVGALESMGLRENTLILYIWGDNGSSAEGQGGSISELLAQNQIPSTIQQQIEALKGLGGLGALGSAKVDNMYHAGWAWAGSTPFKHTKLVASHFGGTRNPMVVSWPNGIKPDKTPRAQFHHVNDVAPTLYEVLGIEHPKMVDGFAQDPMDGTSFAYTFEAADAPEQKPTQYFDNNGSRGIYHQGWYACTFGPLTPWLTKSPGLKTWDSALDVWELYDLRTDFSQANDLAAKEPEKLAELKKLFLAQARENKVFPLGAGIWLRLHPEDISRTPYRNWTFDQSSVRMPEFTAPGIGTVSNTITMKVTVGEETSGVLYALGGASGGVTCYLDKGQLVYLYNMMIIEQTTFRCPQKLPAGEHTIVVDTTIPRPGAPATVVFSVDGAEVGRVTVKRTVPLVFTASESFDVGVDLGSPVAHEYEKRRPFKFGGSIERLDVRLK